MGLKEAFNFIYIYIYAYMYFFSVDDIVLPDSGW